VRMSEDFLLSSPVRLPLPFPAPNPLSSIINKSCVLNLMPLRNNAKWLDYSVYRNHGTIHGATWTTGKFGSALSFDGEDDYVDCGNDESLNITDALTIEAWVKPAADISGSGTRVFLEKMNAYGLVYGFNAGHLEVYLGGATRILYPVTLYKNNWYHLVGVWEGSTTGNVYLYINGENVASGDYTGSITSDHALQIGGGEAWSGAWRYFNGTIDEVRIYNRALSAEEIKRLFEWSKSRH